MDERQGLVNELRGFAEGSESARASLMRDAANLIERLISDEHSGSSVWEYGVLRYDGVMVNNGSYTIQQTHRRRKAGPWVPVSDPQRRNGES